MSHTAMPSQLEYYVAELCERFYDGFAGQCVDPLHSWMASMASLVYPRLDLINIYDCLPDID